MFKETFKMALLLAFLLFVVWFFFIRGAHGY
jgi:hypothetical protein